ncbi:FecCD family ABC transporter permease [Williamsia sterculiae]|uniref:FecCD family ABC transporter permease n=1 Tax=Williamsia sterculiae TaxID=1344003 RepID=UPI001F2CA698|nr:iron chelate uptake ABC transporter family permease subunit [Williamsia sterculiae]
MLVVLIVLIGVVAVASVAIGSRFLGPGEVWTALFDRAHAPDYAVGIVRDLRVPRTVLGIVAGLAIGAAGALAQGFTRNPLADPGILGVNAGAACAVVCGVYLLHITAPIQYMVFGLLGAVIAAAAVFWVSSLSGSSPLTLVLAGTGLTAFLLAITSAIVLIDTASLDAWRFWNVGSIAGRGFDVITAATPFVAVGLVLSVICGFFLNVLGLGDDVSRSLGVRVVEIRSLGVLAITLLAGAATAACGPIVFLGLLAPHVARRLCGHDYRWIVPYSALLGASIIIFCDIVGRVVARPGEVQSGVMLSVLGAPFLIALVRRRQVAV